MRNVMKSGGMKLALPVSLPLLCLCLTANDAMAAAPSARGENLRLALIPQHFSLTFFIST